MEVKIKPLTVGPILGDTDTDHARLWGRGAMETTSDGPPRRCFGVARIRTTRSTTYRNPLFFKMNPNFDMTGTVVFTELKPGTDYQYQIGYFFADLEMPALSGNMPMDWAEGHSGSFTTPPADGTAPRSFVFGSCRYLLQLFGGSWFDDRGDKTFESIRKQMEEGVRTDAVLMVGDQIYADDLNAFHADQMVDEFLSRYRDAFRQPAIRRLMSLVPTYMTLDDHEIEDNWPANSSQKDMLRKYPAAMHAYLTYQMSHSPLFELENGRISGIPDHFWYAFQSGCCDFFVMDTRTERILSEDPDEREMISDEQMDAVKAWLSDGSGRVKFIVSSVPFFPDAKKSGDDKWDGFLRQRTELLEYIRLNKIKRAVFLSGDIHCSLSAELTVAADRKFKVISIVSSSFFWPYPHPNRKKFQLEGALKAHGASTRYTVGNSSEIHATDNFIRVDADLESLTIKVYSRKGKPLGVMSHRF